MKTKMNSESPTESFVEAPPDGEVQSAGIPAWLAARRSRLRETETDQQYRETDGGSDVVFDPIHDENSSAEQNTAAPESGTREQAETTSSAREPKRKLPAFGETIEQPKPSTLFPLKPTPLPRPKAATTQSSAAVANTNDDLPWQVRVRNWLKSDGSKGLVVSALLHMTVLTILGFIITGGGTVHDGVDIFGESLDSSDSIAAFDLTGTAIDTQSEETDELFDAANLAGTNQALDVSGLFAGGIGGESGSAGGGGGGGGNGTGNGSLIGSLNIPKHAITKGSFSAWTVPKDPEPGESYKIVILLRLPERIKTYRASDLSGKVVGTDKWVQPIPTHPREVFTNVDGKVQVEIEVPGAEKRVRDTIRIESKLLREKQVIELEF